MLPVPFDMSARRRRQRQSENGPPEHAREQSAQSAGSSRAMPDQPLHIADSDAWWSLEDANLPVGKTHEPDEDEDRPIPGRRLLIAGIAIFVITVVSVVFLPDIVAVLTPMGAMLAFGAIVASAVVTAAPRQPKIDKDGLDDAKPISCGGVRPVGEMSRRMANKNGNDGCGPGGGSCGC